MKADGLQPFFDASKGTAGRSRAVSRIDREPFDDDDPTFRKSALKQKQSVGKVVRLIDADGFRRRPQKSRRPPDGEADLVASPSCNDVGLLFKRKRLRRWTPVERTEQLRIDAGLQRGGGGGDPPEDSTRTPGRLDARRRCLFPRGNGSLENDVESMPPGRNRLRQDDGALFAFRCMNPRRHWLSVESGGPEFRSRRDGEADRRRFTRFQLKGSVKDPSVARPRDVDHTGDLAAPRTVGRRLRATNAQRRRSVGSFHAAAPAKALRIDDLAGFPLDVGFHPSLRRDLYASRFRRKHDRADVRSIRFGKAKCDRFDDRLVGSPNCLHSGATVRSGPQRKPISR